MNLKQVMVGTLIALSGTVVEAQSPVDFGKLTCVASDVDNRIISTTIELDCEFDRIGGRSESHTGTIKRVGIDLSIKDEFAIVWAVTLAGDATAPNSIEGTYFGASADVAFGVGGGARVLIGGTDGTITLSPTSIVGVTGAGASFGLEEFTLTSE